MKALMKYFVAVVLSAMLLTTTATREAEARYRYRSAGPAIAAGVAGLIIGGALAASASRSRSYYGGYDSGYGYAPTYYQPQPSYYYYQPRPTYYAPAYSYGVPPTARYAHQVNYYQNGYYAYRPARVYHAPVYRERPVYRSVYAPKPRYRTTCNREVYIDRYGRRTVERTCREVRVRARYY